jgi:type IV pilus biogenesis protein CpaD/CtpE
MKLIDEKAIREMSGVVPAEGRYPVVLREREQCIEVSIGADEAKLSTSQARRLAGQLLRLAYRVEVRRKAAESPKPE